MYTLYGNMFPGLLVKFQNSETISWMSEPDWSYYVYPSSKNARIYSVFFNLVHHIYSFYWHVCIYVKKHYFQKYVKQEIDFICLLRCLAAWMHYFAKIVWSTIFISTYRFLWNNYYHIYIYKYIYILTHIKQFWKTDKSSSDKFSFTLSLLYCFYFITLFLIIEQCSLKNFYLIILHF